MTLHSAGFLAIEAFRLKADRHYLKSGEKQRNLRKYLQWHQPDRKQHDEDERVVKQLFKLHSRYDASRHKEAQSDRRRDRDNLDVNRRDHAETGDVVPRRSKIAYMLWGTDDGLSLPSAFLACGSRSVIVPSAASAASPSVSAKVGCG